MSYSLEGVGYIVAGTFLVAATGRAPPVGNGSWVLVGPAAVPSPALWARQGRRWSQPSLLLAALVVQAIGIALPALIGSVAAVLLSAVLFGGTFPGISMPALATGAHLRFPRSVALLTAGYSVGQILARSPSPRCCTTATSGCCCRPPSWSSRRPRPPPCCGSASRATSS
ncbi:YbfB/YjiJ family MFS transporter [Streptomyces sp. NPDC001492]